MFDEADAAYRVLQPDADAWNQELHERRHWEPTLADDHKHDPPYPWPDETLAESEQAFLTSIGGRLNTLRSYVTKHETPSGGSPALEWFHYLAAMKAIQGNTDNDLSFVACLLAKAELQRRLPVRSFDVAEKSQSAPGFDNRYPNR